mgnify:CR=1 FL=1
MNKLAEKLRSMHKQPEGDMPKGITININMPPQGMNPMLAMMMKKLSRPQKEEKKDEFQKVEGLSPSVSG